MTPSNLPPSYLSRNISNPSVETRKTSDLLPLDENALLVRVSAATRSTFAGTVVMSGRAVDSWTISSRIFGIVSPGILGSPLLSSAPGVIAEYIKIQTDTAVAVLPDFLSFNQGAALAWAWLSASAAFGDLISPARVAIISAVSGCDGLVAKYTARRMGLHVVYVSDSDPSSAPAPKEDSVNNITVSPNLPQDLTSLGPFNRILDQRGGTLLIPHLSILMTNSGPPARYISTRGDGPAAIPLLSGFREKMRSIVSPYSHQDAKSAGLSVRDAQSYLARIPASAADAVQGAVGRAVSLESFAAVTSEKDYLLVDLSLSKSAQDERQFA